MTKLLKEIVITESNTTVRLFDTNHAGEQELEIVDRDKKQNIHFRNVGARNKNSSIQFVIEEYNKGTNRTKYVNFSIPLEIVSDFLEHLSTTR